MCKRHLRLFLALVGCHFLATTIAWSGDINLEEGIVFGQADQVELQLDMASPADGNGPYPALVYIFDSDWGTFWPGSRSDCRLGITKAAERGYVAVAIDYGKTAGIISVEGPEQHRFPDQVYDVKCAVRWLRANAKKYRVDPENIGAAGFCCGGYLALMLGLTSPSDGLEGSCGYADYPSRVQAVVCSAAPTELTSLYNEKSWAPNAIATFIGGSPWEMAAEYEKASPVSYVYRDSPPVLIIHGDVDRDIPIGQAFLLDERMNGVGASHSIVIRKNRGHNDFTAEPEVFEFFDKYLKKKH